MLEHPVGAGCWGLETFGGAVAGVVDAIFVEEVDHGHDAGDVDAGEVADAAAVVRGGLKGRELMFGHFALADGVVVVLVSGREDVDVMVGVIVLVALADALKRSSEDAGCEDESGENGGG